MKITELVGRPHVFTMKDGKTLRIFSRETKEVSESNISDEIKVAESMGLVLLTKTTDSEVPKTTKKSGGTK